MVPVNMSKTKLEERIEQLRQLRSRTLDEEATAILRKSLRDRSNLIVAEAARAAGELRAAALIPDLLATFEKLFEDPVKTDTRCWGKTAIVKALTQLEHADGDPFLRGARHVQMEPVFGGQEDFAVKLRATSILGLVQCSDATRAEVLRQLVDALTDDEDPVRIEAVRAIEQMNGEEATLLLRLKARIGDRRPIVIGQVFDSLLNLASREGVVLVSEYLKAADPEIRDEAALALGASRLPEGVKALIDAWHETVDHEFRGVLLRALSSSRQQEALDFLLDLIRTGSQRHAELALDALKLHEKSPDIQALIERAKQERS
jgi:HEAT repeat protein